MGLDGPRTMEVKFFISADLFFRESSKSPKDVSGLSRSGFSAPRMVRSPESERKCYIPKDLLVSFFGRNSLLLLSDLRPSSALHPGHQAVVPKC